MKASVNDFSVLHLELRSRDQDEELIFTIFTVIFSCFRDITVQIITTDNQIMLFLFEKTIRILEHNKFRLNKPERFFGKRE